MVPPEWGERRRSSLSRDEGPIVVSRVKACSSGGGGGVGVFSGCGRVGIGIELRQGVNLWAF